MPSKTVAAPVSRAASACSSTFFFPEKFAGLGFYSVDAPCEVSEQHGVTPAEGRDGDGGAHRGGGPVDPLETTRVGAQGLHGAAAAADEDLSGDHRGLRVRGNIAFKRESPFELQALHLIDAEASCRGGLEAGVGDGGAPAVPSEFGGGVDFHTAIFAEGLGRRAGLGSRFAEVGGYGFAFVTL